MIFALLSLLLSLGLSPARAQEEYGARGVYPVYETAGQWVIFDKKPKKLKPGEPAPLALGSRFLVVGSAGAELFTVTRTSATYGGACRKHRPLKLRAALLKGPRGEVGKPIIGIKVPDKFTLKGSQARYTALRSEVDEGTYARLSEAIKAAAASDIKSGAFRFAADDNPSPLFLQDPRPEQIQMKIDFGTRLSVSGLAKAFVLVDGVQVSSTFRRCLRLFDLGPGPAGQASSSSGGGGSQLIADCVEMPHALMAETGLLRFVAYDPSGRGSPYLLAYTPEQPLWGDERWGFVLRSSGPRMFLNDAMDPRCREGF